MTAIIDSLQKLFSITRPLPPGIFHYQASPDAPLPYRLHLRLEPDGRGLLVVNATTILHLNQTAAEYAYHLVQQTPVEQMAREITSRYRVKRQQVNADYKDLKDSIHSLINSLDADPEVILNFERTVPHTAQISAPYRLDCAITYRLEGSETSELVPLERAKSELATSDWFSIFDKAWNIGIPHILITGGEPTVREDLPELIAHTESNGQVVGLLTDGLKLADAAYLNTLLQTGLDHIMQLLNPANDISWQALKNILSADLFAVVHLTLTLNNAISAPQILKRLNSMGVQNLSLSTSDSALHGSLIDLRNQSAALGFKLFWDLPVPYSAFNPVALETQQDNLPSGAGHSWLYVEPDGDVLPAQGINQVLGNMLTDPWEKLWR